MSEQQLATTQKAPSTIKEHLASDAFKQQLSTVLPKHCSPERMARVAMTALMRNPDLAKCTQPSFFQCMLSLSQWGLEPDGRNAHLIPFANNRQGTMECTLILDYKGLVELCMRTGNIESIHADVVRENDEFEVNLGEVVKHKINYREPRGEPYAVWARVKFKNGGQKCEVMTISEVESIRARSRAKNSGPWVSDFLEMSKKTVFRRLTKWIPLSAEIRDALAADFDSLDIEREKAKPKLGIKPTSLDDLTSAFVSVPAEVEVPATQDEDMQM